MTHLQKPRLVFVLKRVLSNFPEIGSRAPTPKTLNPRFYGRSRAVVETDGDLDIASEVKVRPKRRGVVDNRTIVAQDTLLEYLHSTRNLQFLVAETMSKNCPHFLDNLLKKVKSKGDIGRSMELFLNYHPINEFEPFLESMGLEPHEYVPLLPRGLMFLSDDGLLLENYHVLCNYGVRTNKMGRIYKEATEVFRYGPGVLESKLLVYEEMGIKRSVVAKLVASSPSLLVGNVYVMAGKVFEKLKSLGVGFSGIEGCLSKSDDSCEWGQVLEVLCLLSEFGFSDEELSGLISKRPRLLFEGDWTFVLIGLVMKFGFTMSDVRLLLKKFPQIRVKVFVSNFRRCFQFLNDIEMETDKIGDIVLSHPLLLGSCNLKKTNSILATLGVGEKRVCNCISENPQFLKNLVLGRKTEPLPSTGEVEASQREKTKFLLELGFEENSAAMEKVLKKLRGKGGGLQERFDCIVKYGLDRNDVAQMIKKCPQILNQTKEMIQEKIDYVVNGLGFPISSLVTCPSYLDYSLQRIKFRFAMYNWLKEQGAMENELSLRGVVEHPDKYFISKYVTRHPEGLEVWEDLRRKHNLKE